MLDTCPKCSAPLDADAIFCPSCAAPVNPQCPSCGKSVSVDAKFCKYCAFDLTQKVSVANAEKSPVVSTEQTLPPKQQVRSGIDGLLADKYHAMSDSQLLAMLRGDLSGQTERSLSIALAELETRTNIDWRDMAVAKTRVKEAIVAVHSRGSVTNTARYNASQDLAREKAERLAKAGGITAGISVLFFLWGYSYTSNFANSARAGLMNLAGQTDSTYQLASLCVLFGALGFLVGLILFIVGMAQRPS
jgi:Double zinc ribbon